jgi:hypothetical protein
MPCLPSKKELRGGIVLIRGGHASDGKVITEKGCRMAVMMGITRDDAHNVVMFAKYVLNELYVTYIVFRANDDAKLKATENEFARGCLLPRDWAAFLAAVFLADKLSPCENDKIKQVRGDSGGIVVHSRQPFWPAVADVFIKGDAMQEDGARENDVVLQHARFLVDQLYAAYFFYEYTNNSFERKNDTDSGFRKGNLVPMRWRHLWQAAILSPLTPYKEEKVAKAVAEYGRKTSVFTMTDRLRGFKFELDGLLDTRVGIVSARRRDVEVVEVPDMAELRLWMEKTALFGSGDDDNDAIGSESEIDDASGSGSEIDDASGSGSEIDGGSGSGYDAAAVMML